MPKTKTKRTRKRSRSKTVDCSSADIPTTKEIFNDFWAEIVCPNGRWDLEQIKKELTNFKMVMDEVSLVYDHVTGGAFSKLLNRHEAAAKAAQQPPLAGVLVMAKVLKNFSFRRKRGPHAWDLWLNGKVWELQQGVDFSCSLKSLCDYMHKKAKARGKKVQTQIRGNNLIVQAFKG